MSYALSNRMQLELLHKLRHQKTLIQRGFTLVELMIVVAIIGILAATSLPQFLGAKNAAEAATAVASATASAKECAVYQIAGVGTKPTGCSAVGTDSDITSAAWANATDVKCLGGTISEAKSVKITVIGTTGEMACAKAT